MIIQQLLTALKPGLFIDAGTYRGGLAYFVSSVMHLLGLEMSRVITIDIQQKEHSTLEPCTHIRNNQDLGLSRNTVWRKHVREVVSLSISSTAQAVVRDELRLLEP